MTDTVAKGDLTDGLVLNLLASLMDAGPDVVSIVDLEGRVEDMNREGRRLFGITGSEQRKRGASWPSLWPIEVRLLAASAIAAAIAGERARFEARCPPSGGVDRWWDTIVAPVRDGRGRVIRILATSRDITELRRLRVSACTGVREPARTQLDTLRHDLMTPLHGLLGMAHLLGGTTLTAEQQTMLESIRECGEALEASLNGGKEAWTSFSAAPPAGGAVRAPNVLVVDDNRVNRELLKLALEAIDAAVTTAENGAEACDLWDAHRFDLVIMDLQMPVMDGLSALRCIRSREADRGLSRTPVVAFTASGMGECELASRAAGADGFLTKPLSPAALIETVSSILQRPEAKQSGAEARH